MKVNRRLGQPGIGSVGNSIGTAFVGISSMGNVIPSSFETVSGMNACRGLPTKTTRDRTALTSVAVIFLDEHCIAWGCIELQLDKSISVKFL